MPTAEVVAAGADEVSAAVATLFTTHGRQYQAAAEQVAASYEQFIRNLAASVNSYASTEGANIAQLVSRATNVVNEPVRKSPDAR